MRVFLVVCFVLGLLMAQTWLVPFVVGQRVGPDLFLLSSVLMGCFWTFGRAVTCGFLLGGLQGWLQGTGLIPFAVTRSFGSGMASWMSSRWLWSGWLAPLFAVATATFASELLNGSLLALFLREPQYLALGPPLAFAETLWSLALTPVFVFFFRRDEG
ncbi:MAG: hypothetical protein NZ959_07485 [Armatimonadetes bacterium]|nr:hypothetical protein [Armatimonadota bacterium]MDW8122219.1 hypothetical protein [Armatimonadota bacterium]